MSKMSKMIPDARCRLLPVLAVLACMTLRLSACAAGRPPDFGRRWVRSHPLTMSAWSSNRYGNWSATTYQGANMNLTFLSEDKPEVITRSQAVGLPWIFHVQNKWTQGLCEAMKAQAQGYYDLYRSGCGGWMVWDEPNILQMPTAVTMMDWLKATYPDTLVFSSSRPETTPEEMWGDNTYPPGYGWDTYLKDMCAIMKPDVLMYFHYPFVVNGDGRAGLVACKAVSVSRAAKRVGIPYWLIPQATTPWGGSRVPSESDVRMQVFVHLTYGFTGFVYFTYEVALGPAIVDTSGNPTALYYHIRDLQAELARIGPVLRNLTHSNSQWLPAIASGIPPNETRDGTPYCMTRWAPGRDDTLITYIDTDYTKPGNIGPEKQGLFGSFFDDYGNNYFMVTNAYNGMDLSAAQCKLDFLLKFNPSVTSLVRYNRLTGAEEIIPLVNKGTHTELELALPGGTGDLFRFNKPLRQEPAIGESEAHWSYEANNTLANSGWTVSAGNGLVKETVSGGVCALKYDDASGALSTFSATNPVGQLTLGNAWTMDWRARVPMAATAPGTPFTPLQLEGDYYAPDNTKRRWSIRLGKTTDFTSTDCITVYDYPGTATWVTVQVPGLDIRQWNVYRVVGYGDGRFKLYVNDIPYPVFIGTMRSGLSGTSSSVKLSVGLTFTGGPPNQYTGETDYIRLMTYTAIETPPLGAGLVDERRITGIVQASDYVGDKPLAIVKVELKDEAGNLLATRDTFAGGAFTFPFLPQGNYQVVVRGCQWVTRVIPVTLGTSDVDLGTITLVNGDVDGDSSLTTTDLSVVIKNRQ